MNPRAALKATVGSWLQWVVTMDRGWKATLLGVGLLGLALVL